MFVFIETKTFTRLASEHLADEEFRHLQNFLSANPQAGDVVSGSGGVRKLRWRGSGRGKRGGLRVIYFVRSRRDEIWLLTLYAKNVAESISARELAKIREDIDEEK